MDITIGKGSKGTVELSTIKPGETFVYGHEPFESAVSEKNVWMVVFVQPAKASRVTCVMLDGSVLVERDADHRVYRVNSTLVLTV